jgi:hypothetical protein
MVANAGILIVKNMFEISMEEFDRTQAVSNQKVRKSSPGVDTDCCNRLTAAASSCVTGKQVRNRCQRRLAASRPLISF